MIDRYTLPEMARSGPTRPNSRKWLDVEIAVCEVHAEMGTIPREALEEIKSRAKFPSPALTKSRRLPITTSSPLPRIWRSRLGMQRALSITVLTSSDVVDTANALLLREACDFC